MALAGYAGGRNAAQMLAAPLVLRTKIKSDDIWAKICWQNSYCVFAATTGCEILFSGDEGDTRTHIIVGLLPIAKRKHHLYLKGFRALG
jgi:hypothetical protein